MKIAFYAPLKPPDHPVPSGDRQMARLLVAALRRCGHEVEVASVLRAFLPNPSAQAVIDLESHAATEITRIEARWAASQPPGMWFCYHPYFKAPDLIGPQLARRFALPYVTAEASYSGKRDNDGWGAVQARIVAAVRQAKVNICFTERDREGLIRAAPVGVFASLKPFIDTAQNEISTHPPGLTPRLVTVAMMRKGDKLRSYTALAAALALIVDIPWRLTVVGDGPARSEVQALFGGFEPERITWAGQVAPDEVGRFLGDSDLYVWPGLGEAYGLSYLEAQACGLPVIAQNTAGVPEVVRDGETGCLTPEGDVAAYAAAVRGLLMDREERKRMADEARRFVHEERSLDVAAKKLEAILVEKVWR